MAVRFLRRGAFHRGVLGGSNTWFTVWAFLGAARLARRFGGDKPKVLFRDEIKPGETLVIRHGERAGDG